MTEIDEICKNIIFGKPVLPLEERFSNNSDGKTKRKCRISNKNKVDLKKTDNDSKLQPSPGNNVPVNYQTEPLDLSSKPNPTLDISSDKAALPTRIWKPKSFDFDQFFSTYIRRYTANDVCNARCSMLYKDHYHCFAENGHCKDVMKGKDKLRQHGKLHSIAEELTELEFSFCVTCQLTDQKSHYHCNYSNCDFISNNVSNMERLSHVDTTHCVIISKRSTGTPDNSITSQILGMKRRRKSKNDDHQENTSNHVSDLRDHRVDDNQFIDFDPESIIDAINKNSLRILDRLSPEKGRFMDDTDVEEVDKVILMKINEAEKNFFYNGYCARLFCNLKKSDHYHCPICDRGSSKKDLYIRHLKQRHK